MALLLADAARTAEVWLKDAMLPLWTTAGFDGAAGQFVEALTPDGEPLAAPRRTLVQARQMAVCAAGGRLGWSGAWAERATVAGETLMARGRGAEGDWIYGFDAHGRPADGRSDLYTQAFVMFGFAEAGRALGRGDFVAAAADTRDRLDAAWTDPLGGFLDGEIAPHPGRQNPHMHLLEASLALHAASGEAGDLEWASRLADLCVRRLMIAPGQIAEEYDAAWRPIAAGGAAPGHQFEWAWLLERLRRAGGPDHSSTAATLAARGERFGVDAAGFALDGLALDGTVMVPTARLWPQAERLKAALARADGETAAGQAWRALSAYLEAPTRGAWRDLRLANGGWLAGPAPASSGYHVVGAVEALIEAARDV